MRPMTAQEKMELMKKKLIQYLEETPLEEILKTIKEVKEEYKDVESPWMEDYFEEYIEEKYKEEVFEEEMFLELNTTNVYNTSGTITITLHKSNNNFYSIPNNNFISNAYGFAPAA